MNIDELDILIDVNETCILNGMRESPSNCPIALAVDNAVKAKGLNPYDITVDGDIMVDGLAWSDSTAVERQLIYDFISDFDNEKVVEPFKMLIHLCRLERDYDE